MTVLITGGAGFIGRHLARRLVAAGDQVVALDTLLPQVHPDADAARAAFPGPVHVGDVADPLSWDALDAGLPHVDAVVHLAAETGTSQSMYEPERHRRTNVEGTRLAAAFAEARGIPLVSLSSRAVYGEGARDCPDHGASFGPPCCARSVPRPSREDDPHRPVSVYGETKSAAETLLADVDTPVTIVRPQNVIGPGQSLHNPYTGVLAAFLAMLREGRPLTVYGTGDQTRDLVHVDDVADLLHWLLEHPPTGAGPRVLNCGTGTRTSLLELARFAQSAVPPDAPALGGIVHVDVTRAGDIVDACADLSRLDAVGAPRARWSTADAVADFVSSSWSRPGARADAWDGALTELADRGMTS